MNKLVRKITTSLIAVAIGTFVLASLLVLPNVAYSDDQPNIFNQATSVLELEWFGSTLESSASF